MNITTTAFSDLQELLAFLGELFDGFPDAVAFADMTRTIRYVNEAFCLLLGRSRAEFLGASPRLIYADIEEFERKAVSYHFSESNWDKHTHFVRLRHRDGYVLTCRSNAVRLYDKHGQGMGILVIYQDFTERLEMERRLNEQSLILGQAYLREMALRNNLSAVIQQLPVGIQIFDADGLCVDVNKVHMHLFGIESREQVVGVYNIFQDPLAEAVGTAEAARRALAGQGVTLQNILFDLSHADPRSPQGQRRITVTIFPLRDVTGEVMNIVGLSQDMTLCYENERQNMELALQKERNTLLQELIGDISHDLRTPLTILGTSLYLFSRHAPPEAVRYINRMEEQIAKLNRLFDSFLAMARLDHQQQLTFNKMDLAHLLRRVISAYQVQAEVKDLNLHLLEETTEAFILGNEDELTRAFDNLIENALRYTEAGGEVSVAIAVEGADVEVRIQDTGVGIAPEDLPHIFERFYRADKARRADTGGSGLGLAIAKRIFSIHGGDIHASSQLGQGTLIRVSLPLWRAD